jgi:hypothetical protein
VESTRGLQEDGSLRGGPRKCRPWPARDTKRDPSHPGKPGAMGRVRRDRTTPGSGGSAQATKGCSASFGGGKLAKSPKGCESFAPGCPVRSCTGSGPEGAPLPSGPPGLASQGASGSWRIRLGSCCSGALPAACSSRANAGQTLGDHRPRKGHVIEGGRGGDARGCARTLLSRCRSR